MKVFKLICLAVLLAGCTASADVEQQVDKLYQRMTQEERIAQLRVCIWMSSSMRRDSWTR